MKKPTLSVIMPNYNYARFLPRALDAILSQSVQPVDITVTDDASTDESVAILRDYAARHSHLRVITREKNRGLYPNMNEALLSTKGDYVIFPASDDYIGPGYFERALKLAEQHPDAGAIIAKVVMVDDQGKPLGIIEPKRWPEDRYVSPEDFLKDYMWGEEACFSLGPTGMYRRECYLGVGGFPVDAGPFADALLVQSVARKWGVCYCSLPGSFFRLGGAGTISGTISMAQSLETANRTVELMRSERFAGLFPEDFIQHWHADYLRWTRKHLMLTKMSRWVPGFRQALGVLRFMKRRVKALFGRKAG